VLAEMIELWDQNKKYRPLASSERGSDVLPYHGDNVELKTNLQVQESRTQGWIMII
jgi:hypothetical protein